MTDGHFSRFAPLLRTMSDQDIEKETERPEKLVLAGAPAGARSLDVAYAPFDHVNPDARIVVVGLTPGKAQAVDALTEARRALLAGDDEATALRRAKVFASFSGAMRRNLIEMLNGLGVPGLVGIGDAESLWRENAHLVQFTSLLRYPVFIDGENYSGTPNPWKTPLLRDQIESYFAAEARQLKDAIFVPLGGVVAECVEAVAQDSGIDPARVLSGLPHASGANAERISYFMGRKDRSQLSSKVDPDKLDAARSALVARMSALGGRPTFGAALPAAPAPRRPAPMPAAPARIDVPLAVLRPAPTISDSGRTDLRIPYADDGTLFGPELRRRNGFTIGAKGSEITVDDYATALGILNEAGDEARWRRPNESGNWGIKRVARWEEPAEEPAAPSP